MSHLLTSALALAALTASSFAQQKEKPIRLLVRMDDMGSGRSVEVIMPGQWVPDAVRIIAATPGLDAGVHLGVTSEWDRSKWRPLTPVKSFVDADGRLVAQRSQPQSTRQPLGFLGLGYDTDY